MALTLRAAGANSVLLFGFAFVMISFILQGCGGGTDGMDASLLEKDGPEPEPEPTPTPAPEPKSMTEAETEEFVAGVQDSCKKACDSKCGLLQFATCGKCLQETCKKEFEEQSQTAGYSFDTESPECKSGYGSYDSGLLQYVEECAGKIMQGDVAGYLECCIGYVDVCLKFLTPCIGEGGSQYR